MVRETLIQSTVSRNVQTMNIEFENVKFLRATTITIQKHIEMTISIQLGSGHFELSEGNTVIVTGYVRVIETPEPVHELHAENQSDSPIIDQEGFYKELRLRGYHYDGIFKSVKEARADGSQGKIKWVDNNWPAFMDCLLQMSIISQDSRALFLPTSIRKLRINTQQHYKMLAKLDSNEPVFDVHLVKELDMAVGGGVEIIGLSVSAVGRRKPTGVEVWESYTFVPQNDATLRYSTENALRIIAQVIVENGGELRAKLLEIDDLNEDNPKAPLVLAFDDVFAKMPLVDVDLKVQTSRPLPDLDSKYVLSDESNAQTKYDIVVNRNALSSDSLSVISNRLTDDGYLLSREFSWEAKSLNEAFTLICVLRTQEETLVLLRKTQRTKQNFNVVEISASDTDFGWLSPLQNAIKNGPVLLVAQQSRFSGIMGLLNCIRKEPNCKNIRLIFTVDENVPKFSINNPFYSQQLALNMTMNVYRNGHWGTYRHLALIEWQETKPQSLQCWARIARVGDLSSFGWVVRSTPTSCDIDVHYSSINFKDVMIATGRLMLPDESRLQPQLLGFEFSGIDSKGERVMGMLPNCGFSTKVESFENMVWRVPKEFTLREAATIPVAYITVYYAFFCVNKISRGKSILIHAGSGAVGLAAIRTAFAYGMEVFTTVSTPQKKQFIMDLFPKLKGNNAHVVTFWQSKVYLNVECILIQLH